MSLGLPKCYEKNSDKNISFDFSFSSQWAEAFSKCWHCGKI
jgi:hypothetical protein